MPGVLVPVLIQDLRYSAGRELEGTCALRRRIGFAVLTEDEFGSDPFGLSSIRRPRRTAAHLASGGIVPADLPEGAFAPPVQPDAISIGSGSWHVSVLTSLLVAMM
jgi:hypothetical protein